MSNWIDPFSLLTMCLEVLVINPREEFETGISTGEKHFPLMQRHLVGVYHSTWFLVLISSRTCGWDPSVFLYDWSRQTWGLSTTALFHLRADAVDGP